jgi:hypothetical protein
MKLRTMICAALASLALSASAFAGDINAPAVTAINKALATPVSTCTSSGCSGLFAGAEISGSGTGVNIINLGSLNAAGTFMGGNVGYQFFNGTYWISIEANVDYQVANPNSSLTPSLTNVFAFEGMEFGGNLTSLFNIAPITLPGPLANAVPTVKVGACQHGNLQGYCAGAAAHFFIPNSKWTIDATYLNAQYSSGTVLAPGATANTENRGTFGATYHF